MVALGEMGQAPPDRLRRAADWLIAREVRRKGDWSVKRPDLEPSGWAFEFAAEGFQGDLFDGGGGADAGLEFAQELLGAGAGLGHAVLGWGRSREFRPMGQGGQGPEAPGSRVT